MTNRDYHHHSLKDALADAERLIGLIRMANKPEQVRFTTGYGVIREALFKLLQNYQLSPTYELSNPGAILVEVE